MRNSFLLVAFLCLLLPVTILRAYLPQSGDPIEQTWYNEEQTSKIQIFKESDGKFYGKIIWLKVPLKDGKAKTDDKNPDKEHTSTPLIGLLILKNFHKSGTSTYEGGTIYDPKNGKTYSCKITMDKYKLDVRGFVGFSLFGRTTVWTLAN